MAYGGLPDFGSYLDSAQAAPAPQAPAQAAPQASGTGNWLTAGLGSGFYGQLANIGGFGEAAARAVGADSAADSAAAFADRQRATAQTYARPDLEAQPWYSPGGFGYRLAQMIPGAGVGLAGAAAGAALAPEEAVAAGLTGIGGVIARHAALTGATLASYPGAVGEDVQASKEYNGDLSQGNAAKALVAGVPQAALQGIVAGKLEGALAGDVGGGFLKGLKTQAITQAAVAPASDFITQMMGDPNRPMGDRAQQLVEDALQGGVFGAATGGVIHAGSAALHAIAKIPVQNVTSGSLFATINEYLNPVKEYAPPPAPAQFEGPQPNPVVFGKRQFPSFLDRSNLGDPTRDAPDIQPQLPLQTQQDIAAANRNRPKGTLFTGDFNDPTSPNFPAAGGLNDNESDALGPVREPSPQLELPLTPPGQVPVANPQVVGTDPTPQPPAKGPSTNPADAAFPAAGGVNRNEPGPEPHGEPTGQQVFTFAKPGSEPVANPQAVQDAPTSQPPVKGPTGDVRSPDFPATGGVNRNEPTPGPVRDATAQGDALSKPDEIAPANDKFDQSTIQSDMKRIPSLRDAQFKTQTEAETAIAKEITDREAAGKVAPPALIRIADELKILTPDKALKPEFLPEEAKPEGPDETLAAGPQAPEAPPRDAIKKGHQPTFDRLQALRDALGDNLSDPDTFGLVKKVTDLQNELQDVKGSQRAGKIKQETTDLEGQVRAKQRDAATPPPTDPTAIATSTKASPDTQAFIDKATAQPAPTGEAAVKAKRAGKAPKAAKAPVDTLPEAVPAVSAPEPVANPDAAKVPLVAKTGEAAAKARKAAKPALSPRDQVVQAFLDQSGGKTDTSVGLTKLRQALKGMTRDEQDAALAQISKGDPELTLMAQDKPSFAKRDARPGDEFGDPSNPSHALWYGPKGLNVGNPDVANNVDTPKQTTTPRASAKKIKARINDGPATEAIQRQKNESQTIQAVESEVKRAPKVPVTPEITALIAKTRAALEALKSMTPRSITKVPSLVENVVAHERQLNVLEKAANEGGLGALRNFRPDHFDDKLWTDHVGRMTPDGEAALEAHANAETDLIDAITRLRGERPLIRYSVQPTQGDVNLTNVIAKTGKLSDALAHITQNDPSPANRLMSSILERQGLDTDIRMAGDDQLPLDTTRKLGEGQLIAASHNDALNRISVYDGANVSRSVLHEAIHAATVRALAAGSRAASAIREIFDNLSKRAEGKGFYGMTSPEEMVAEAGSNPQFQQFLKSEPWQINGVRDAWQALKNSIFKALGMPERVRTAFDQVMDSTQKLMAENPTKAAITGDRPLMVERGVKRATEMIDAVGNQSLSRLAREADGVRTGLTRAATDGILGFAPSYDVGEIHNKTVPTFRDYVKSVSYLDGRKDTYYKTAAAALHSLEGVSKKGVDLINAVARRTFQGLDGSKTWAEHPEAIRSHPKADVLKQEHADARTEYNELSKADGGKALKAFNDMRAEYATKYSLGMTHQLWDYASNHAPELLTNGAKGFESNPFYDYDKAFAVHDSPKLAQAYAQARESTMRETLKATHSELRTNMDNLAAQVKADDKIRKAIKDKKTISGAELPKEVRKTLDSDYAEAQARYKQLNTLLNQVDAGNKQQAQSPYAHLGREGEHFVGANLAKDDGGVVKEAAIAALRKELGTSFKNVAIMQGSTSEGFYARVGSETERRGLVEALVRLQKAGHIDEGSITRGLATDKHMFESLTPATMREIVEQAKANVPEIPPGSTDKQKQAIIDSHKNNVNELMRSLVELIPKTGFQRLYQYREGVNGFNADMVKNFRSAAENNSAGLANLTMASEIGGKRSAMNDQVKDVHGNLNLSEGQVTSIDQAHAELLARSQKIKTYSTTSAMDAFRKASHVFSVGMSPVYVMTLIGQIFTNSLPQLGSVHGYVEGASALGRATNKTFKITSAVARGQDAATFGMRESTLRAAGLDDKTIADHMELARRGLYAQGYTDSVSGHQVGGTLSKVFHYANSMGRYAEMAPRVQLGEAAMDLFQKKPVPGFKDKYDYAEHVINEAQFGWGASTNARQLTRAGVFGVMSPLVNQFMGFQTRMTAKLYREVHGAVGGDKQAQKWLLGHAAAVAALSGTLGLPMVSVAASVYDRLADWATGSDDHDVIASYRTFLAHAFGKDVGEVIARGAPRAVGIDFDHAGEGAIAPGSSTILALTEKRKLEDAERDWLKNMGGHSVGFMFHLAAAARDFSNGDYLDATEKMTPELIKGGVEAYRLSERGFVDKNGQKLPITASTGDIMQTAMGLDPAKEAEYNEEQKTATGLNQMRQIRSQNITRHLLLAQSRGDGPMFQEWEREATQFQMDHPGMAGPLQDFGRELATHARSVATAKGFGTPLGVKPRDIVGRGMTAFGNLRNDQ
jgi:hypothetical protein